LNKLYSIVTHVLIIGDFNCSPGSRFFKDFADLAVDNNVIRSVLHRLVDAVT